MMGLMNVLLDSRQHRKEVTEESNDNLELALPNTTNYLYENKLLLA